MVDSEWAIKGSALLGIEILRRTAFRLLRRPLHGYLGWLGHGNAGDEAVFAGLKELTCGINWTKVLAGQRLFGVTNALGLDSPRYLSSVTLGGGTLIGPTVFLHIVEELCRMHQRLWACGTGVGSCGWSADPEPDLRAWRGPLNDFTSIGVRGPLSLRYLEDLGISRARVVGDLALSLALETPLPPSDPPRIAVNLSTPVNSAESLPIHEAVAAVTQFARKNLQQGARLVPLAMDPSDIPPLARFCAQLNLDPQQIYYSCDARAIINHLADCSLLIGVRLHSAVLATCAGVRPILFGYRPKCFDFMASMGLQAYHIDLRTANVGDLQERIAHLAAPESPPYPRRREILSRAKDFRRIQVEFVRDATSRKP